MLPLVSEFTQPLLNILATSLLVLLFYAGRIFGQAVLFIFAVVQQQPLFLLSQGVVLCIQ